MGMNQPAGDARAREIAATVCRGLPLLNRLEIGVLFERVAAALTTARAEGYREGVAAAAALVLASPQEQLNVFTANAIRNLSPKPEDMT